MPKRMRGSQPGHRGRAPPARRSRLVRSRDRTARDDALPTAEPVMADPDVAFQASSEVTRLAGAALFGWIVPPLLLVSGRLWTEGNWSCVGVACAGVAIIIAIASGLCLGYLVGLIWGWTDGLVSFGAAVLAGAATLGLATVFGGPGGLSEPVLEIGVGYVATALIGLLAYPSGILVRWLPPKLDLPWLGLGLGVILVVVAVEGFVPAPPGIDPDLGDFYAIPLLVAGAGTVLVSGWSWLRGAYAGSSSR